MNNSSKRIAYLFTIFFTLSVSEAHAQFFYYGQEPSDLHWKQMDTPHFTVYFTNDAQLQAYYYAKLLEKNYSFFRNKTGIQPRHTDVIIHNRNVLSNGFSVPAPQRMEINTIAPQRAYAQDWYQQLAIHEFQHSLQIQEFREGFARHLSWLFGDAAVAGAMARLPFWFIEGQAVAAETAYSEAGRGRDADFMMKLRAAMIQKGIYSYDKAINGSYKDYSLNHYNLGYHLVAYGKTYYGDSLWQKVRKATANRPYALAPFGAALKRNTGKKVKPFYEEAMQSIVKKQHSPERIDYDTIPTPQGEYKSYLHPGKNGESVVAYRESYSDITAFVQLSKGQETVLHYPGGTFDEAIAFGDDAVYWSELYYDQRWGLSNYAVIKKLDYKKKKAISLTSPNQRYFAPDIASNRGLITAVKANTDGTYNIVVLKAADGEKVYEHGFPNGEFVITPHWSDDEHLIIFVKISKKGKGIYSLDPSSDDVSQLFPTTNFDIAHPYKAGDSLMFVAPFKGKNDLYAYNTRSKELYRLTDAPYGINYPHFEGKDWVGLSDYTADGYKPLALTIDDGLWEKIAIPETDPFELASGIKKKPISYEKLPEIQGENTDFNRSKHLFNFHSLTPFGYSKDDFLKGPGVSVHSQNLMSTLFTSAGYFYDYDEDGGSYFLDVSYDRWYPRINLSSSYGNRERLLVADKKEVNVRWRQVRASGGVEFPFRFNAGAYSRFLSLSVDGGYRLNDIYSPDSLRFTYDEFATLESRLYYSNLRRQAKRDLYPKYGQIFDLHYLRSWLPGNDGHIMSAEGWFFFPGLAKNQHFHLYTGYQYNSRADQPLSGYLLFPRGLMPLVHQHVYTARINYSLPLFYPDWSMWSLAYFKRVSANIFVDAMSLSVDRFDDLLWTTGAELWTETHLLRLIAPADVGLRTALDVENESFTFEMLFRLNLNIY